MRKNYESMKRGELWSEAKKRNVAIPTGMQVMRGVHPDYQYEDARKTLIADLNTIDTRRESKVASVVSLLALSISTLSFLTGLL